MFFFLFNSIISECCPFLKVVRKFATVADVPPVSNLSR